MHFEFGYWQIKHPVKSTLYHAFLSPDEVTHRKSSIMVPSSGQKMETKTRKLNNKKRKEFILTLKASWLTGNPRSPTHSSPDKSNGAPWSATHSNTPSKDRKRAPTHQKKNPQKTVHLCTKGFSSWRREYLPVCPEGSEVTRRSGCGDSAGRDNSSCGIYEDPLTVSYTQP